MKTRIVLIGVFVLLAILSYSAIMAQEQRPPEILEQTLVQAQQRPPEMQILKQIRPQRPPETLPRTMPPEEKPQQPPEPKSLPEQQPPSGGADAD
jgi:hypothetical protein